MYITKTVAVSKEEYQDDIILLLSKFDEIDNSNNFLHASINENNFGSIDVEIKSLGNDFEFCCNFQNEKFEMGYVKIDLHSETFDWRTDKFEEVIEKVGEIYKVFLTITKKQRELDEKIEYEFGKIFR